MLIFKPEDITLHGLTVKSSDGFYATNMRKPGMISVKVGRSIEGPIFCDFTLEELETMVQMFEAANDRN